MWSSPYYAHGIQQDAKPNVPQLCLGANWIPGEVRSAQSRHRAQPGVTKLRKISFSFTYPGTAPPTSGIQGTCLTISIADSSDKLLKFSWVVLTMSLSMVAGLVCACPTEMREFKWHSCSILQGSPLKSGWTSFPASRVLSFQDAKGAVVSYIMEVFSSGKYLLQTMEGKKDGENAWFFFYSPLKSKISSCKCH